MTLRNHHLPVQTIEQWARSCTQKLPFSALKDTVIGVDASHYLDLRLNGKENEPLINALCGTPYALRGMIEHDLEMLKKHDIKLIFVFDGLDFVNKGQRTVQTVASLRAHEEAWQHYMNKDGEKALVDFGRAKYPVEILYRHVQNLLFENGVEYQVAPYSATAQLSYLYKLPEQFIDVVMSSADSFLFDTDKIITNFDVKTATFEWLNKSVCQDLLDRSNDDLFRNAQLLLGSVYLPMFPPLDRISSGKPSIRDALNLLMNAGRSVMQLCHQYRDDAQVQNLHYADRYKKALMTIKHHVVLKIDGSVAPLDFEHAPGDVHEFVGTRLPEELFFYISKGMYGPQISNWLSTGEIILSLPGSVIDNVQYRTLVIEKLNNLRSVSLKLLADSLNRYWQTRTVNLKVWVDRDVGSLAISMKEAPSFKARVGKWKVKEADFTSDLKEALATLSTDKPHSCSFIAPALEALNEPSFAERSASKASPDGKGALKTTAEVVANVFWRFLHMTGYVDDDHKLTPWGKTLLKTLTVLDPDYHDPETALVAVEMLRLGVFQITEFDSSTTPDHDKALKNIVTRVASFGRFKHEAKGFSGPLDRQLLTFAWMIHAVRSSLRDLLETNLVSMLLNGDVDRERDDWSLLPNVLPFITDSGAGLGIVVRTYVDEVTKVPGEVASESLKDAIKQQSEPYVWFQFGIDYEKSLKTAFGLWDAVYEGAKLAGQDVKDAKLLAEANEWLAKHR